MTLSAAQLRALEIVERSASALSILGILIIIVTFCSSRYFRNPIDRLIFINAIYNIFDATATMISLSGPSAGNGSALCQFQGFLMQMFPLADVLWTLAMAIDVFLIVFYRYDAESLRKLEVKYIGAITVITFIPALIFLFIHTEEKGHMYGSVTIWCAIAPGWIMYRIIFYYGPIWLVIGVVLVLYCLVGWKIVKGKRAFKSTESDIIKTVESDHIPLDAQSHSGHSGHSGHQSTTEKDTETGHELPTLGRVVPAASSRDGAESISQSISPLHPPAESINLDRQWQASRSALSLRQYLLMPVMFFIVLLAIWVAPTTNRILSFAEPSFVSFPLYVAVGSTGSLRGFWNGIVFLAVGMRTRRNQKRLERERPLRLRY